MEHREVANNVEEWTMNCVTAGRWPRLWKGERTEHLVLAGSAPLSRACASAHCEFLSSQSRSCSLPDLIQLGTVELGY